MISLGEMFGGVGSGTYSAKALFDKVVVKYYIEKDKNAVKSYNAINGTDFKPTDINDVNGNELPYVDVLIAGWPCQDFSKAGKSKGLDGERSNLILITVNKIKEMKEKPKYIILENVKNLVSKTHIDNFKYIKELFEELGYNWSHALLNSLDFGLPQNRERVFILLTRNDVEAVDISVLEQHKEKMTPLSNYIDMDDYQGIPLDVINGLDYGDGVKQEYTNYFYLPPKDVLKPKNDLGGRRLWKIDKYVGTIPASYPLKICYVEDEIIWFRKLTSIECWRLMGFWGGDHDKCLKAGISKPQLCKQAGNSIDVNIMFQIFRLLNRNNSYTPMDRIVIPEELLD